jgi:hypothetical protein
MATHTVTWTIDVDAKSHEDAVQQAHDMARDPESIATYYRSTLIARPSDSKMIDVLHLDEKACIVCGGVDEPLDDDSRCETCGPINTEE